MAWTRERWHRWLDEQLDSAEAMGKQFNVFTPNTVDTRVKKVGKGRKQTAHVLTLGVYLNSNEFLPEFNGSVIPLLRSGAAVIVAVPKDTLVDPDDESNSTPNDQTH